MKKLLSVLLVLLMAVNLAACGNNQDAGKQTEANKAEATKAADEEKTEKESKEADKKSESEPAKDAGTIKVAVVGPMTGPSQEYGIGFQYATQVAVDQINAKGGINGRKVELKVFDNKATGEEGVAIAQLIAGEGDFYGVVGHFGDTMVIGKTYEDAGVIYIAPAASSIGFTDQGEHVFRLNATIQTETEAMFVCADKIGKKKLGIVAFNNDWGAKATDILKEALEKDNPEGYKIVAVENVLGGDMDYTSVISNLKEKGAEVAVMFCYYDSVVPFSIMAEKSYPELRIVAGGNCFNDTFLEVGGQDVEGCMAPTVFDTSADDPASKQFVEDYRKLSGGMNPSYLSAQAYDAMSIILQAAESTNGELDRDALRAFVADEKHTGVTGDCTFDENRDAVRNFFPMMVKDGMWVNP